MQQMQLWPSQLHWQSPSHSALVQVEMPSACSTTLTMEKLRELMAGKRLFLLFFFLSCHYIGWSSLCFPSGHSPQALTLDLLKSRGYCEETPPSSFDVLNVTVPGAPACWWDTVQQFGSDKVWHFFPLTASTVPCALEPFTSIFGRISN